MFLYWIVLNQKIKYMDLVFLPKSNKFFTFYRKSFNLLDTNYCENMPYKRVKATVFKKKQGSWTKKKTCKSPKKAKKMVEYLGGKEERLKRR